MAETLNVGRLLRPRSVAIVGASPEPGSIGNNVLANLARSGFSGSLHLVSRNRTEIAGHPCVRSIDDLPDGVDAVVLVVPEAAVPEAVAACVRRKAGSALVFASGFAEAGEDGRAKQDAVARAAREGGLVLSGPNCIGFANFAAGVALTFEPRLEGGRVARGAVAIAQSGAMTTNLRVALLGKGVPVALAVSTGNEAVAGVEDFVADALGGGTAALFVLFIEQVRRPRLFLELMREARVQGVPVLMLHPGRTRRAREAALTHTGALAGDHAVMATALAGENVLLVDTLDELFDTAALVARWPKPPALGAGVVTNSGAFRGVALDFCAATGLDLPALAPETQAALKAMLPPYAAIDNPLDITTIGIAQHDIFGKTAAAMLADPAVGALIAAFIPGPPELQLVRARSLLPVIEPSPKPVAFALFGDDAPLAPEFHALVRAAGVPFIRSPDRALRAVAQVARYGRLLARQRRAPPAAAPPPLPLPLPLPRRGALTEHAAKRYLAVLGIAAPEGALARTREEARAFARGRYPVALKAQSAALAHKTEAGGVLLGSGDERALDAAWDRLHANLARTRPGLALDGVLVEREAPRGLEMIVGARRDPDWGAVLMLGLGGIWAEALDDLALLGGDSGEDEIMAALGTLKGAKLIDGHRGHPALDKRAVARVALALADLVRGPGIAEVEINPLAVYPDGVLALDALIVAES